MYAGRSKGNGSHPRPSPAFYISQLNDFQGQVRFYDLGIFSFAGLLNLECCEWEPNSVREDSKRRFVSCDSDFDGNEILDIG
jgi:hypothetical protein